MLVRSQGDSEKCREQKCDDISKTVFFYGHENKVLGSVAVQKEI